MFADEFALYERSEQSDYNDPDEYGTESLLGLLEDAA